MVWYIFLYYYIPNRGTATTIPQNTPVYSVYTGNFIQNGPVLWGTPSDDSSGRNKNFHGIVYYPDMNYGMIHDPRNY